ncbi:MAG: hypothetical protein KC708_25355, partial [Anaerolineae bacterium]|nr:hypothetical protein [Anaerolineae bacterium]
IIVSNLAQKDYKLDVRITGSGAKQGANRIRLLSGGSANGQLRIYPKLNFDEIEKSLRAIARSKRFDVHFDVVQIDAGSKEFVVGVRDPSEIFGRPILKNIENRVNVSPQYSNNPLSGREVIDYVRWLVDK